jgi:hypothetical protein
MMILAEVGDLVQMTGDGQAQVASCAVCTIRKDMKSTSLFVEYQNQGRRFFSLCLKTGNSGLVI